VVTRVVVLADSPLVRAGLEALLGDEPAVQVVRAAPLASFGAPALGAGRSDDGAPPSPWEQAAELAADVVLWAPDAGPGLAGRLVADLDDAPAGSFGDVPAAALPALVVVADLAPDDAVAVLRAGARAVLPPSAGAAAVGAAVGAAAAGLVALPARDAAALLAADPAPPRGAGVPGRAPASARCWRSWPRGSPTSRSPRGSASASTRSRRTSRPCSPSSAWARAPRRS
jgi:DNA-binding NarL/FixJ family response regulator